MTSWATNKRERVTVIVEVLRAACFTIGPTPVPAIVDFYRRPNTAGFIVTADAFAPATNPEDRFCVNPNDIPFDYRPTRLVRGTTTGVANGNDSLLHFEYNPAAPTFHFMRDDMQNFPVANDAGLSAGTVVEWLVI
jgi:hypothetical protein